MATMGFYAAAYEACATRLARARRTAEVTGNAARVARLEAEVGPLRVLAELEAAAGIDPDEDDEREMAAYLEAVMTRGVIGR